MSTDEDRDHAATRSERQVLTAFVAATVGAVGFTIAYAVGASTIWIGVPLAVAFVGLGYGLVAWGHGLMPTGGEVEQRTRIGSPSGEEREAGAYLRERGQAIGRRGVLGGALATALGATGLAALVPLRSFGPRPGEQFRRTAWSQPGRRRLVTTQGRPVAADELDVGGVTTVFPEGHEGAADAQTLLIRLPDNVSVRPPGRPEWVARGHVAYSKVCTHAGCPVGLYEAGQQTLFCPCHQSAFEVLDGARPIAGPATRALPQLPLSVDQDGFLVATGDFDGAVGPGWWTRP